MGFLEHIGLSRKRKLLHLPSGHTRIGSDLDKHRHWPNWITLILFLGFLIAIFPRHTSSDHSYRVGELWRNDDLVAPFTFSLIKNQKELEEDQKRVKGLTPPVFYFNSETTNLVLSRLDSLFRTMEPVMESYVSFKQGQDPRARTRDSLEYVRLRNGFFPVLDETSWSLLQEDYLKNSRDGQTGNWIGNTVKINLENTLVSLLNEGIIDTYPIGLSEEMIVRDQQNRTEKTLTRTLVRDTEQAREYLRIALNRNIRIELVPSTQLLFDRVIQPNLVYNKIDTQNLLDDALGALSPTASAVAAGQLIIQKGEIITDDILTVLQSLAFAKARQSSSFEITQQYLGEMLVIFAIVLVFFLYIYLYRRSIFDDTAMFSLVFLSMGIVLVAGAFVAKMNEPSLYLVPVAICPILLTVIFDSRVGLMATLTMALLLGMMSGNDFEYTTASLVSSSIAVFSVRDIKRRSQFYIITPALVFIAFSMVILGFSLIRLTDISTLGLNLFYVSISSILIILTPPLILLFEKLFRVTTDLTLFELSETNKPLLKALMMQAPGTFHHSLQVANLCEASALAIGADALLCRVGALYHDIGKMERPDYFVENQTGLSEHEHITPHLSVLVIKSHVSAGVKMAEEAKLPSSIIDFIKTHHGTSIIRYFYEKAKAEDPGLSAQEKQDYYYDGPLPTTKETGILLLADCVEASTRTLKNPTYSRLEQHIHRIVDDRLKEGQLNDCPLTYQDIGKIKQAFLNVLVGVYHSRIEYPEQEKPQAKEHKPKETQPKENHSKESQLTGPQPKGPTSIASSVGTPTSS